MHFFQNVSLKTSFLETELSFNKLHQPKIYPMYNISSSEKDFKYPDADRKKPLVPAQDEKPVMGLRTTKNFITTNAVENIMSVPKNPEHVYVDTKKGDKHLLDQSGLQPKYVNKKVRAKGW
jgi:hypothetical protein